MELTKATGIPVFKRSDVFSGTSMGKVFRSNLSGCGMLIVILIVTIVDGMLLSLCVGAGSNFLLHTMKSGSMLIASLTGSRKGIGVLKLTVTGKLITLSKDVFYRRRHMFRVSDKANTVMVNLTDIVVKADLFGGVSFVGTAATILVKSIVCGTYITTTLGFFRPRSVGLVATMLFLLVLMVNKRHEGGIGGGTQT